MVLTTDPFPEKLVRSQAHMVHPSACQWSETTLGPPTRRRTCTCTRYTHSAPARTAHQTRAERELAMDQEVRWSAAHALKTPVDLEDYDEEKLMLGRRAGLPRDPASDSFIPPEVRFTGAQQLPPAHPPMPWNPKMVTPIWLETRGPFEAPADDAYEWARTGRRADAGVRRYSAYANFNNRDGPRMMPGQHPSRSALRPMAPTPVRTIAAHVLECRNGIASLQELGSSADSLECGIHGHLTVHYSNGKSRPVRGAFLPERRPFTGLRQLVPPSAGQTLECNPRWTQIMNERSQNLNKSQKGVTNRTGRRIDTRGSMKSTTAMSDMSDMDFGSMNFAPRPMTGIAGSRPMTRGTDLSATFADEEFMNDVLTSFDAESRAVSHEQKTRF